MEIFFSGRQIHGGGERGGLRENKGNSGAILRGSVNCDVITVGKVDADRDKAVIFNVDICDYYFIILKYNIISQRFSV